MSNLLAFPDRQGATLGARVRAALLAMSDSSEMTVYLQQTLPALVPHLGAIEIDCAFNDALGQHVVYVLGRYPGLPMTFRGQCLKSCLVACAVRLCAVPVPKPGTAPVIVGITPVFVPPLAEFKRARP